MNKYICIIGCLFSLNSFAAVSQEAEWAQFKAGDKLLQTQAKAHGALIKSMQANYDEWAYQTQERRFDLSRGFFFTAPNPARKAEVLSDLVGAAIAYGPRVEHLKWAVQNGFDAKTLSPLNRDGECDMKRAYGTRMMGPMNSAKMTTVANRQNEIRNKDYFENEQCDASKKILSASVEQLRNPIFIRRIHAEREIDEDYMKRWDQWSPSGSNLKRTPAKRR